MTTLDGLGNPTWQQQGTEHVVVEDMAGYDRTYKALIGRLPSLADVSALFSMERLKSVTGLPIPAES